jgi:hypothetical protein
LSDLYTAARAYDATYQAAKQQSDATLAKAAQAQALLLPTVGLSASANQINQDTQATRVQKLRLRQPVRHLVRQRSRCTVPAMPQVMSRARKALTWPRPNSPRPSRI